MKIISIEQYSCSQAPQGKALTVLKTENNWLWLTALVKKEGFQTPFFSLREIEISQKLSDLKLISQKTISVETGELFMSISEN